jgi:protein AFG1
MPDLTILPAPSNYKCSFLKDEYCAELSKDSFVIVTCAWAALQLTWTFMLLFVHFFQVSQNITTYENMRHAPDAGPLLAAVTSGTTSLESANVVDSTGPGGHSHPHAHKHASAAKRPGLISSWCAILGVDTFIAIAFQGYKGSQQNKDKHHKHPRKTKPFSRGIFRNCQDFWMDGPLFGLKQNGKALLGGEAVDYTNMYEVPRKGMQYRGEYARVADDVEEAEV